MAKPKWGKLETELRKVDLRTLHKRELNARFMEPVMFKQLCENIRTDGGLTSTPLVYSQDDGGLELLSGHHRTEAAIECGFFDAEVIVILTRLTEERKKAIQISHNSVTGKDDPSLLAKMWEGMDLDSKRYSGLSEKDFEGFGKLKLDAIGAVAPKYEESLFLFLPEDAEIVHEALERLGKGKARQKVYAGRLEAWNLFFDTIVRAKTEINVFNSGMALLTMCQLAGERLDQLAAEREAADSSASQNTPKAA